jgi:maltose alpha-D-glucosyltransferase/alpha-amylase
LRDAAGMLRSIDYAAHLAIINLTQDRPQDHDILQPYARQWRALTAQAFLEGYEEAIAGCGVYPEDSDSGRALIHFFTLEKVLYEITYELGSRPAWVSIPLHGLLDLIKGTSKGPDQ